MSEPRTPNPSTPGKSPRSRKRSKPEAPIEQPQAEPLPTQSATAAAPAIALSLSTVDRDSMIRTAAYFRAERRHFESGHSLEDWLAAESEIDAALLDRSARS